MNDSPEPIPTTDANATRRQLFWEQTRRLLRAEALAPRAQPVAQPSPYLCERVTYRSLGGYEITAALSRPAGGSGPWPGIVTAPGYGGWEFGVERAEAQRGYVILQVYPRLQGESAGVTDEPEHVLRGLRAGPEDYYYRGAYCDVLRGLDYLRTRPEVDARRLATVGTSQGGALALAAAALDADVRACVAHVPYLCDLARSPAFAHLPLQHPAAQQVLDYFDPVQLAAWIYCPTLISSGGQDHTSPAAGIALLHRRLPGVRSWFHDPQLAHASSPAFHEMTWQWLARWLA